MIVGIVGFDTSRPVFSRQLARINQITGLKAGGQLNQQDKKHGNVIIVRYFKAEEVRAPKKINALNVSVDKKAVRHFPKKIHWPINNLWPYYSSSRLFVAAQTAPEQHAES